MRHHSRRLVLVALSAALLLLPACAGGLYSPSPSSSNPPPNPTARASAVPDLRRAFADQPAAYHAALRRAAQIAWDTWTDRDLDVALHELASQGLNLVPAEPATPPSSYECVLQPRAYTTPSGQAHDLILAIDTAPPRPDGSTPVINARAVLRTTFGRPIPNLAAAQIYPAGTALDAWLGSELATELAAIQPVLDRLDIWYGPLRTSGPTDYAVGFRIRAVCLPTPGDESAGVIASYSLDSNLDSPRTRPMRDWTKPPREQFQPRDTFGALRAWGYTTWGR
jgi:hypothetical protein